MAKKKKETLTKTMEKCCGKCKSSPSGCVYGLGFIGALVYYVSTTSGVWGTFVGVLKALVWPAFVVYEVMKFLGM